MSRLDQLKFEPDEELRKFLENCDKYGVNGDWPSEEEQAVKKRIPYRGREPINHLRFCRNQNIN